MDTNLNRALVALDTDALLQFRDVRQRGVAVFKGSVWVTHEGDPDDIVLHAGESMPLDRPGLTLLQALQPAQVLVFDAGPTPAPLPVRPDALALHRAARRARSATIAALVRGAGAALRRAAAAMMPAVREVLPVLRRLGSREQRAPMRPAHAPCA